jgi:hypothetical protein
MNDGKAVIFQFKTGLTLERKESDDALSANVPST